MINYQLKKTKQLNKIIALVLTGSVIIGCSGASAAEGKSEFSLDQIVVTANRVQQKEFAANANITVVTREDIERNHYTDVSDAIRRVSGVTIQDYSGAGESYTSNGLNINGSPNVVLLIDGMRANTNGSTFSKAPTGEFVNMDRIERIEVLKGAASTLYGSDAQGGVINIITRKPKDGVTISKIGMERGSYGKQQYNFSNSGSQNGFFWTFDAQKRLMNDYSDAKGNTVINGINSQSLNFKLGKTFNDRADAVISYQKYDLDYEIGDSGTFSTQRKFGTKKNDNLNLMYNQIINDKLSNKLSLFKNNNVLNSDYKNPNSLWYMDLTTEGFSNQLTYKDGNHTVAGGIDYYIDKVNKYWSSGSGYNDRSLSNMAFFIQDEWQFAEGWSLTPGIRFDKHNTYGHHTTPSIVLGYNKDDKTNYYAGYKEFFVAPNQYQVFSNIGSKDLQPEAGKTIEFGVNHRFTDDFTGTFHIFKTDADNMIGYKKLPNPPYYQYYNTGAESMRGWDIGLKKAINDNLNFNVNYAHLYIDPANGKNPNRDGRLPRGTWNIGVNYTQDKVDAFLNARGVMNREGGKSVVNVDHDAYVTYWVVDTGVNYKVSPSVKVYAKINNLFNKYYSEYGTAGKPAAKNWYSMPGRNYLFGVEYSF